MPSRAQPNIIITGTPGVGKTSHCEQLAANTGLKHLSINQIVKDRTCHDGWDAEYKSWIVDEDKVIYCSFPFNGPNTPSIEVTKPTLLAIGRIRR